MSENDRNLSDDVARRMLQGFIKEQRRARHWSYFWRFMIVAYVVWVTISFSSMRDDYEAQSVEAAEHIAVVDVIGPIARDVKGVDASLTIKSLKQAFEAENATAVVLQMDSPGGSASQSDMVYRELLRLKEQHDKPVIAVVGDLCASGCYYIASAADRIIANQNSIVGNIGVKMESFGINELMQRFGVDRRVVTAGDHKSLMDPFAPEDKVAIAHIRDNVIFETYSVFKGVVSEGRKGRIDPNDEEIFSGLIWAGESALNKGLIDGFGNLYSVARENAEDGKMKNYTVRNMNLSNLFNQMVTSSLQYVAARLGVADGVQF